MNFIELITSQARKNPEKRALVFPRAVPTKARFAYPHLTFAELHRRSDNFAFHLAQQGIHPGDQVLLLIKPSLDFMVVVCGLFKLGAIPLFIDPGMGWRNFRHCLGEISPKLLIAEPAVHYFRRGLWWLSGFSSGFSAITTGTRRVGGASPLALFLTPPLDASAASGEYPVYNAEPDALAAVLFTSGGTGIPKGVAYSHRMFTEQARQINELFSLTSEDIHLAGFPPFALFTLAMGCTSVIAPINHSRPATADPKILCQVLRDLAITRASGSPAIWQNLAEYCSTHDFTLPQLKALMMFGAPVPGDLHRQFAQILPHGTTYTPYGATECLPVSCISGEEIVRSTLALSRQGKGTCIGRPVAGLGVKIISPSSEPYLPWEKVRECGPGEVGEIIVHGPQMSRSYFRPLDDRSGAASQGKISQVDGRLWHRMGDLAYFDGEGRLWFCGRKAHRVEGRGKTWDSIPCESIFNAHPAVRRTALIAVRSAGEIIPGLVIERRDHRSWLLPRERLRFFAELRALAGKYPHTADIQRFFLCRRFPVDTRHNIKIDRLALAQRYGKRSCRWWKFLPQLKK